MSDPAVTVRLQLYEIDGRACEVGELPDTLLVESHGIYDDRVVLTIDGHRYTVIASYLADAAQRARKPR